MILGRSRSSTLNADLEHPEAKTTWNFPIPPGQPLSEMAPSGVSMNLEMTKQPVFPSEPYAEGKA